MVSIFVLDDDISLLQVIEIWLPKHGYQVSTFPDSTLLFEAIRFTVPDIIFLDVQLAELHNGKSVCTELKQQFHFPNKIFLFSATPVTEAETLKCGADGFINKPFDISYFEQTLKQALSTD